MKSNCYINIFPNYIRVHLFFISFKIKIPKNLILFKRYVYWNTPGVWDFLGGNFKDYICTNNMYQKLNNLKKDLDKKSSDIVDILYRRLVEFPTLDNEYCWFGDYQSIQKKYETDYEKDINMNYYRELQCYKNKYKFIGYQSYNQDVFYFHHGLRFANIKIKNYIKGKDFIDGGAYIGDSALILLQYLPKRIYSFEFSKQNIEQFKANLELNNIEKDRIVLVDKVISDKKSKFYIQEGLKQRNSVYLNGKSLVEAIDLDTFCISRHLNVGFIKLDIEGFCYEALQGMKNIVMKNRPVMTLAIYHNPKEFFEVKPMLEDYLKDLNYKIEIIKMSGQIYHPLIETCIFAYPKELFISDDEEAVL